MRLRDAILIVLGAMLLLMIAVYATRIVGHHHNDIPGGRVELGRVKITQLDESTRNRLANLQHDVLVTYYVSGREHMPSEMRRIERDVTDLLRAMRGASNGRFDFQIVDPHEDTEFIRHAAHQRAAPFRVRSVARDSYTERTVYSTLHIAYGSHEPAVINGVSSSHLPRLQSMIVGQLDQKDFPREPVFAISGPPVYRGLARWLEQGGRVVHIDLDGGGDIPDEVDVLFWMDPRRADANAVRQIQQFLESGRSAVIAGSRHAFTQEGDGLYLRDTGYDPEYLLASFGLRPIDGMVLDERSQQVPGDMAPVPARFLVRCIPPNQDFREMRELPNGHFLFAAPTPLSLDAQVLAERGLSPTVLATTSDRTSIADMIYGEVNLASARFHEGDPVPKLPLMVWLRPHEPWAGSLVVSAASSPFRDGAFEAEGFAHRRLAEVLAMTLASDERLVIHRAGFHRAEPLPALSGTGRLVWRIVCIALVPALIGVLAWRRGVFTFQSDLPKRRSALPLRGLAIFGGIVLVASTAVAVMPAWRIDLTAERTNRLAPASAATAAESAGEQAVTMTLIMSRSRNLPPELRPMQRRLRAMIAEFQRAGADLAVQWVHPEDLDNQQREALEADGVTPVRITTRDEDLTVVRTMYSAIRMQGNGQTELLQFPDRASFEHLEFRLAFALWRLRTGKRPHIAFASDVPRLSAAEAYHDFQQRGLMAPTGTDVYSHARKALEQADFRVTHLNPHAPHVPQDVDLIVWMQPRRDILPMLDMTAHQLHAGVPVVIAAQQFNMQARQYRGAEFKTVYWPQPQVVDLHLHFLPDLGIELVHEVLFDELHSQMDLQTQVNLATGERKYEMQTSALPFLIRASAANFATHPIMRNVGDQLLPFAAYWRLDEQRLGELGISATPLMTTSHRSWTYNWAGGWIPDDLLAGPERGSDEQPQWLGRLPLGVLLEGAFPRPLEPLTIRRVDSADAVALSDEPGDSSSLLLIGCSEMFKNHRLRQADFRADHVLLNAAAKLALDEGLASIASHRRASRGFDYVEPETRLRWRAVVLGTGPAVMMLFAIAWFAARTRLTTKQRGSRA